MDPEEEQKTTEPDLPEKKGWLQKRSTSLIRRWQDRYFVLKNRTFEYFYSENDPNPSMTVNFNQVSADMHFLNNENPQILVLKITGCKREFNLRSIADEDLYEWAQALAYHICDSKGTKMRLVSIGSKDEFWRFARITPQDFVGSVQSGDLLLFKSKSIGGNLQRKLTLSEFDHVALLLKHPDGSVGIFESTGYYGVKTIRWSDFIDYNWYLEYKLLVYRKLDLDRDQEFHSNLSLFMTRAEGKNYSLSPAKMFKKTLPGDESTYFCSELVASTYKALGLLDDSEKSSSYLPVHFSSKKNLQLLRGCLSQEYAIDFQLI